MRGVDGLIVKGDLETNFVDQYGVARQGQMCAQIEERLITPKVSTLGRRALLNKRLRAIDALVDQHLP